jgi:hypothetical protein
LVSDAGKVEDEGFYTDSVAGQIENASSASLIRTCGSEIAFASSSAAEAAL